MLPWRPRLCSCQGLASPVCSLAAPHLSVCPFGESEVEKLRHDPVDRRMGREVDPSHYSSFPSACQPAPSPLTPCLTSSSNSPKMNV